MNLKQQLYKKCEDFLNQRFQVIQDTIADLQNSLQSETKSSAGDKHETGRAMLQLEREKAGNQFAEIQKLQEALQKIDSQSKHTKVALGSVVKTTQSHYFIAISAGELVIEDTAFYAVSPLTPIAQVLHSKQVGDEIIFRENSFTIKEIL